MKPIWVFSQFENWNTAFTCLFSRHLNLPLTFVQLCHHSSKTGMSLPSKHNQCLFFISFLRFPKKGWDRCSRSILAGFYTFVFQIQPTQRVHAHQVFISEMMLYGGSGWHMKRQKEFWFLFGFSMFSCSDLIRNLKTCV